MRRQRGFTLIELLIVVAIIGIIAAIAIPNLLNALHRGRQKRTMADMRTVATATGTYMTDANFYPRGIASMTQLVGHLQPVYLAKVPNRDAWRTELDARSDVPGSHYTLVSYGKNKATDGYDAANYLTTTFNADIYIRDDNFIQWPEGLQTGE